MMSNTAVNELTLTSHNEGVFFKCPVGGFASLSPGVCPKCREALNPVVMTHCAGERGVGMTAKDNAKPQLGKVMMGQTLKTRRRILAAVFAAIGMTLALTNFVKVSAHGGEDHGEKKAVAISTSAANMIVRAVRAGNLEVTMKHPPIEPDKEQAARVFVTRFETNEPVGGAKIIVMFASGGGAPVEATATPGNTPGLYEVKLPPTPEGEYKLSARVETSGAPQTIEYGALKVMPLPSPAITQSSSWARAVLVVLGVCVGLVAVGFVVYRIVLMNRRERIKGEAATA